MPRTRIKLAVYLDLDPVPGAFHSAESAQNAVINILNDRVQHYNPHVVVESTDTSEAREQYTACSFALGRGQYCTTDVRIPHEHVTIAREDRA